MYPYKFAANEAAAKKIQDIFRLKCLWDKLTADPILYTTFSNDKIANSMFGAHIANFGFSPVTKSTRNYVTDVRGPVISDNVYHRSDPKGIAEHFHMMPAEEQGNLTVPRAGTRRTKWQEAIHRFSVDENRLDNTKTPEGARVLKIFFRSASQILHSKEFMILRTIGYYSKYQNFNFSLHAQELYDMLTVVCEQPALNNLDFLMPPIRERVENNLSRTYLFLSMLVYLYNNNHVKFGALMEPLVHEISLLVLETITINQKPLINHEQFVQDIQKEFLSSPNAFGTFNINHNRGYQNIKVIGYPANSGMHAYTLSLYIARIILEINDKINEPHFFSDYPAYAYYETIGNASKILKIKNNPDLPNIHIINLSVMGYGGHTEGGNINTYLGEASLFDYHKHQVVIIDATCTDYKHLALEQEFQDLIEEKKLTLIVWESGQKFGLLGTDQAQYGRVVVVSNQDKLVNLSQMNT
ncbi:MAG: hypothetical protein K0S63_1312, partial [Gammaproteobacteria bacterium]|nr:hypothetical protein [Gammaproteobacteria bacterium]